MIAFRRSFVKKFSPIGPGGARLKRKIYQKNGYNLNMIGEKAILNEFIANKNDISLTIYIKNAILEK